MTEQYKIMVVGCGYVGLVTGVCLAHIGHDVICVDKNEERVAALNEGKVPFYEPGFDEFLARSAPRMRFTTELAPAAREVDVLFIAVDTPQGDDGSADLTNVAKVARTIGRVLSGSRRDEPLIVVNKSTVPVGSGDYVSMLIREGAEEGSGSADFLVASNPEFLREGTALYDSLFPDRIVVGADSRQALDSMRELYEPIIEQSFSTDLDPRPKVAIPFFTTDLASAEMLKYAANAFLATKISFINEISNLCEMVGADVGSVAYGIGLDRRIGSRFLSAGVGWGGSCFPKDVAALRSMACEYDGYQPMLLDAVVAVNERQRKRAISKLQQELHTLKGKQVALLGLSFKPNTDDLREAPSLKLASALHSLGARVVGYDPVSGKTAMTRSSDDMKVVFDPYDALEGAHAAVVVTDWDEFRTLDFERVAALMREPPLLIDGRNALDIRAVEAAGIRYRGFGRA